MRSARYPALSTLVRELSAVQFKTDLTGVAREHIKMLIQNTRCLKHVALFPKRGLSVRAFLNGHQLVFTVMDTERLEDAGRIADMVQIFFEKYRLRSRAREFNTTEAQ